MKRLNEINIIIKLTKKKYALSFVKWNQGPLYQPSIQCSRTLENEKFLACHSYYSRARSIRSYISLLYGIFDEKNNTKKLRPVQGPIASGHVLIS